MLDFSSGLGWQSTSPAAMGVAWAPARFQGRMGRRPLGAEMRAGAPVQLGYPSLRIVAAEAPAAWWLQTLIETLAWTGVVLLGNLALALLAGRTGAPWRVIMVADSLVFCFLLLLSFDVRVNPGSVFQPWVFAVGWGMAFVAAALPLWHPTGPGSGVPATQVPA